MVSDAGRGHLLIATVEDANSPSSWSGTPYHLVNSLRREFDKVTLVMTRETVKRPWNVIPRLLFGQTRRPLWMTGPSLRLCADRLHAAVAEGRPDFVLCISSQHLIHAGELNCPTYMVSDAPWLAYKQAYAEFEAIPDLAAKYAQLEADAARPLAGVIYPSPWACDEAARRYGIAPEKVHCVPFGANRASPLGMEALERSVGEKPGPLLKLLFVGKDWERKGGPDALETLRHLNESGRPARLIIAGCSPEVPEPLRPWVQVLGYLSPAVAEQRALLEQAFLEADLFLLPSRAECYGLVFAEAQSWGLPCVALAVQGVPGVVVDGRTGRLCPPDAGPQALAEAVLSMVESPATYRRYAQAALQHACEVTDWGVFARHVAALMANGTPTR